MLLPWARSQVSFLKDLVTLRNPRSRFSFLNYLHRVGRLDDSSTWARSTPTGWEISDYLQWVAALAGARRIRYDAPPRVRSPGHGRPTAVHRLDRSPLADGDTVSCRDLVIGDRPGRHVPEVFAGLPARPGDPQHPIPQPGRPAMDPDGRRAGWS